MRDGIHAVRVCSAYVSLSGSQLLLDGISRSAPHGDPEQVDKTVVASLDFGLTDPQALRFWDGFPNCRVMVAGADMVRTGSLVPRSAFHSKLYLFDRPDGTLASLIGSANLTSRGLTINSESAWLQHQHDDPGHVNRAWSSITASAQDLTPEILDAYEELCNQGASDFRPIDLEPVATPEIGALRQYAVFADADIDPNDYRQMWVQSRSVQGGAGTQLELPRGSHRFFGAAYRDYNFGRVRHIAEPVLVSGRQVWRDRPLTWHGDNAMERINLPSLSMGGFTYSDSLILFRRIAPNRFELSVYPWDSDSARARLQASRRVGLVYRVGRNSNRIAGFLP